MRLTGRVATGLDRLVSEHFRRLSGQRLGVIANPTAVDREMIHLVDRLVDTPGLKLEALFGPEHGVRGDAQDMIGVASAVDRKARVPVHSLYGSDARSLHPQDEQLTDLDVLIFDVQDVGSRYYTFAATMLYAMRAASRHKIRFLVLDRPNPLGGQLVEGPTVLPGFESFVGAYPTPIRHGMTVGELALMFRAELGLDLELDVIPCEGWNRTMLWQDTGIPWVLPSPNMPTPDTANVYPGGCLLEGTNLSEGRGTTRPFELWGAPWLDADRIVDSVGTDLPGAKLRPCATRPTFHKFGGQLCLGVQPHLTAPADFRPVRLYTLLISLARLQDPSQFGWRTEPYEFVDDPIAIDLLYGSSRERNWIESEPALHRGGWREAYAFLDSQWEEDEESFVERRRPYLIYG